jgi:16S rRNA (cytosine967-C5)-methyltransferase
MTPGARVQAAIECLERILQGAPAEKVLTGWARGARYAGSKDRVAVRDHVYHVLRNKRQCAWLSGGDDARRLMIGAVVAQGLTPSTIFTGEGHAPALLTQSEARSVEGPYDDNFRACELPDWLIAKLQTQMGDAFWSEIGMLGWQAGVFLRVNLRKTSVAEAVSLLRKEGIETEPWKTSLAGLVVKDGARKIRHSRTYLNGLVELQDGASQAAMETLPLHDGMRVLDYCAGGGGKTLALAGRVGAQFFAHDANPDRMRDLPARAGRAGVRVLSLETRELAKQRPFDLVLCDVPCSGSGTWRRDPDAKWRFTPDMLATLNHTQDAILDAAAPLVGDAGMLAYATCSLLAEENDDRIAAFMCRNPGWHLELSRHWHLSQGADGFFVAHLIRDEKSVKTT